MIWAADGGTGERSRWRDEWRVHGWATNVRAEHSVGGWGWGAVLSRYGIDRVANDVYRTLVEFPTLDLVGVAHEVGAAVPDAQRAVDQLVELGLTTRRSDGTFDVAGPHDALDILIAREEAEMERRRQALEQARTEASDLVERYVAVRSGTCETVEECVDPDAAVARFEQLMHQPVLSVALTRSAQIHDSAGLRRLQRWDATAASRGAACRAIVTAVADEPYGAAYVGSLQELGFQAREMTDLDLTFCVLDGETTYLEAPGTGPGRGAYVLHGEPLTRPFTRLFEEWWETSRACGRAGSEPAADVHEARLRQVAQLLARGVKDDAIARRLSISTRTVRRYVAAMMAELGAESRFQAACLAVERGWVELAQGQAGTPKVPA